MATALRNGQYSAALPMIILVSAGRSGLRRQGSAGLHPVPETSRIPPRRAMWFSGCPGLTPTHPSGRSRQRPSAKATSQCSVGWKFCLAIAPSPATTNSAASPATRPTTSATQRTQVWSLHPANTMTSMCSCPHSRGPL